MVAGTLLAAIDPSYQQLADQADQTQPLNDNAVTKAKGRGQLTANPVPNFTQGQHLTDLEAKMRAITQEQPDLIPGVFVADLDTGAYAEINGRQKFATASMIKVPVLVAFFQEVDAGTIQLGEMLTMRADLVAPHAGDMQYLPVGTQFSALETAQEMIRISDNTATNMLIDRLGGIAALNERFQRWGIPTTQINAWLPDLEGTNIASPQDLVTLMALVEKGELVSMRSRDRILEILRTPVTNTLLPQGLGEGATIAHKTGDIGSLVGDVGLIDMPNGKRYLAAMMVQRPFNDNRAQEMIRQLSRVTYDHLNALPQTPHLETQPAGVLTQQGSQVSPASLNFAPVTTTPPAQP